MTATAKQTAYAAKLFARHAKTAAKYGRPVGRADYAEDMRWLDLDPASARDVSKYIGSYVKSARDAQAMRRY